MLKHDAIFVGGGNTKSALGVWREWGLDEILATAWRKGILLSGMSAGAICWFQEALTDSYFGGGLRPLACLGLLPDGCCVHFSGEPARRTSLHAGLASGELRPTIAIDDGAAVLFSGVNVRKVVGWQPDAKAYKVMNEGGRIKEHA